MAGNGTNGVFWNPHALVLVARRIAGLATHLSGAIRTELLLWLTGESASASELARRVGVDDARMSRLLGKLREAGVTAPCGVRRPRFVELGPYVRVHRDDRQLTIELADEAGVTLTVSIPSELLGEIIPADGAPRHAVPSRR